MLIIVNTPLATLGIFAVTGALALCDLCKPVAESNAPLTGPLSVAFATSPQERPVHEAEPALGLGLLAFAADGPLVSHG